MTLKFDCNSAKVNQQISESEFTQKLGQTRLTQSADFQPPSAEPFNTDFDSNFLISNTETQLIRKSTRFIEKSGG